MSMSYTIQVSEGVEIVARSGDSICTKLSSLSVLPELEMSQWLGNVLVESGYAPVDGQPSRYVREISGATLEIDTTTLKVSASVVREETGTTGSIKIQISDERSEPSIETATARAIAKSASDLTASMEKELGQKASKDLARALPEIRTEIDAINHRWLSAAIKEKASRLGQVQRVEENESARTLTISIKV
ncbi:MAG: hypothetical protein EBS30_12665 [Planctomycetes bacterium]|nr:hypothetical protein [Planctomycetota bacterium]